MERKFDFLIECSPGFYKDFIRFYPRSSHVHGFHDDPPTSWNSVYKVYYSWSIVRQNYDDNNKLCNSEILFSMPYDECSELPDLSERINKLVKVESDDYIDYNSAFLSCGQWIIRKFNGCYHSVRSKVYEYMVFDKYTGKGYRFYLNESLTKDFCGWLDKINQYMLEHSEGI